jgi:hypothetical protein
MKRMLLPVIGLAFLTVRTLTAADEPRGNVIELHSCELYAGGCVVSSEATLGGRYMLRAWDFAAGAYANTDFAGLRVALLQTSHENLAAEKTPAESAVIYLPQDASKAQRAALLAWMKSSQTELKSAKIHTRVVPLQISGNGAGFTLSSGKILSVQTAGLESCDNTCGAALWYEPRTPTTVFTVALNRSSQVTEPLLKLKWEDSGKRSVFIGKFGSAPSKTEFVTASDWCAPTGKVF